MNLFVEATACLSSVSSAPTSRAIFLNQVSHTSCQLKPFWGLRASQDIHWTGYSWALGGLGPTLSLHHPTLARADLLYLKKNFFFKSLAPSLD